MDQGTERTLTAAIDDLLSKHSGSGLIHRSELVDALLDLRLIAHELSILASLDSEPTRERPAHTPTKWHWHKERTTDPSRPS